MPTPNHPTQARTLKKAFQPLPALTQSAKDYLSAFAEGQSMDLGSINELTEALRTANQKFVLAAKKTKISVPTNTINDEDIALCDYLAIEELVNKNKKLTQNQSTFSYDSAYAFLRSQAILSLPITNQQGRISRLSFEMFDELRDISDLGRLTELQFVYFWGCQFLADISEIASLPKIKTIKFYRDSAIRSLSPLEKTRSLELFSIEDNKNISSLSPFEHTTFLKELEIRNCNVSETKPLIALSHLEQLTLGSNPLKDPENIARINSLESLCLSDCGIKDLGPYAQLSKLKRLYLFHNYISDISALPRFKSLEYINLSDNPIEDYSPLLKMRKLNHVDLPKDPGNRSLQQVVKKLREKKIEVEISLHP